MLTCLRARCVREGETKKRRAKAKWMFTVDGVQGGRRGEGWRRDTPVRRRRAARVLMC